MGSRELSQSAKQHTFHNKEKEKTKNYQN